MIAQPHSMADPARFWAKVAVVHDDDSCWLWTASAFRSGYGKFFAQRKSLRAHRYAYTLVCGSVPAGLDVCHHCDVRRCVRPSHLFVGTRKDNLADAVAKGRVPRGAKRHNAILTEEEATEILRLYRVKPRPTQPDLAKRYGMSLSTIRDIIYRRNWKYL